MYYLFIELVCCLFDKPLLYNLLNCVLTLFQMFPNPVLLKPRWIRNFKIVQVNIPQWGRKSATSSQSLKVTALRSSSRFMYISKVIFFLKKNLSLFYESIILGTVLQVMALDISRDGTFTKKICGSHCGHFILAKLCILCHISWTKHDGSKPSNQIKCFVYIAHNHNHIASMGFIICTVNNILCPSLDLSEEKLAMLMVKKTPLIG